MGKCNEYCSFVKNAPCCFECEHYEGCTDYAYVCEHIQEGDYEENNYQGCPCYESEE